MARKNRGAPAHLTAANSSAPTPSQQFVQAVDEGGRLHGMGDFVGAEKAMRKAIALMPSHPLPYGNLGVILKDQGKVDEGIGFLKKALEIDPNNAQALCNLGAIYIAREDHAAAVDLLEKAIAIEPNFPLAYNNLSSSLPNVGRIDDAIKAAKRALELRPGFVEAYNNLGFAHSMNGEMDEAIAYYRQAISQKPDLAMARKNLGLCLLYVNQYPEGWKEYEWRWIADQRAPRSSPKPMWNGGPLEGKTLLLFAEQGLGDALQFARFVPLLAAQGARVVLEIHPNLMHFARRLPGVAEVSGIFDNPPPHDTYQALMAVPAILGIGPDNIPGNVPYLSADSERTAMWREKLGTHGFKIGIIWQGKGDTVLQKSRSSPLAALAPLAKIDGVRLISLQKNVYTDPGDVTLKDLGVETLPEDFDTGPDAFIDTAAVMENLDLVITIDSAAAHLAGGMGLPVWVALKKTPDWRWQPAENTSPWYPTARLYRQPTAGDWNTVFARMAEDLKTYMHAPRPARPTPAPIAKIVVPAPVAPVPAAAVSVAPLPTSVAPQAPQVAAPPAGPRNYMYFEQFMNLLPKDFMRDFPSAPHEEIVRSVIGEYHGSGVIRAGQKVLDVGCGDSVALEMFKAAGLETLGISQTTNRYVLRGQGFDVRDLDQNFTGFPDSEFDLIWSRMAVAYSPAPLFTLMEYRRLLKEGGCAYVEVPAYGTPAQHEHTPHIPSVLPLALWQSYFARAGFKLERNNALNFGAQGTSDSHWSFLLRK